MAKRSLTIEITGEERDALRAIDRTKDAIEDLDDARPLAKFGANLSKSVSDSVPNMVKSLGGLASAGGPVGVATGVAIGAGIAGVLVQSLIATGALIPGALMTGAAGGVLGLGLLVAAEAPGVQAAAVVLGTTVTDVMGRATESLQGPLREALAGFGGLFLRAEPELTRIFESLAPVVKPFSDAIISMIENAGPGFEDFVTAGAEMLPVIAPLLPEIGTALSDVMTALASNPEAQKAFTDFLTGVIGSAPEVIRLLGAIALGHLIVKARLDTFREDVKTWNNETSDEIESWSSRTRATVKTWNDETSNDIDSWGSRTRASVRNWNNSTSDDITSWADRNRASVRNWNNNTAADIESWASRTRASVKTWNNNTSADISAWASSTGRSIESGIAAFGRLVSYLSGLPMRMQAALGNLASRGYSIGADFVSGIGSGIMARASALASQAASVVLGAVGAARRAISARSPSELTAERIGEPMTEGIAVGQLRRANLVADAMATVLRPATSPVAVDASGTVPSFGVPAQRGQGGGNVTVTFEFPTARDAFEEMVFSMLRSGIRVRGGDVQVALGGAA